MEIALGYKQVERGRRPQEGIDLKPACHPKKNGSAPT
jgi:hypothetical protein